MNTSIQMLWHKKWHIADSEEVMHCYVNVMDMLNENLGIMSLIRGSTKSGTQGRRFED